MAKKTFELITNFLKEKNISFEHLTHEHIHRSAEAAKIRGNSIEQAAKAIILKGKEKKGEYVFFQCVLSGHKKIDFKFLRKEFGYTSVSLADPEDVLKLTGCTIGSVPPFGSLLGLKAYLDEDVLKNEYIFFSAGTHNDSIKMKSIDYKHILEKEGLLILNFSS